MIVAFISIFLSSRANNTQKGFKFFSSLHMSTFIFLSPDLKMQHFLRALRGACRGHEGLLFCFSSYQELRLRPSKMAGPSKMLTNLAHDLGGISGGHGVFGGSDGSFLSCLYQLCLDLQNPGTCETPWFREIDI